MHFVFLFKCVVKYQPEGDPVESKLVAVKITKNKVVPTVFTY